MNCSEALNLSAGVTSIVGSGGKTTLLRILAHELTETSCAGFTHGPHAGATLILATTTHFLPFANIPLVTSADERVLSCALAHSHSVCVGTPVETGQTQGKLGTSPIAFERLSTLADYVIVEADGARHLPLKAHAAHEPRVWPGSVETVLVLGASGLNRPVAQVVHRSALFCELQRKRPGNSQARRSSARRRGAPGARRFRQNCHQSSAGGQTACRSRSAWTRPACLRHHGPHLRW